MRGDKQRGAAMLDAEIERKPKLHLPTDYQDKVIKLHKDGLPRGSSTGWPALDKFYTVLPGQFTIVTGFPGAGKSEWVDALMLNLATQGWKFAVFSFENQPVEYHITKMLEKLSGKPFTLGQTPRLQEDDVGEFNYELSKSFAFTECASGAFSLKDTLDAAQEFLKQFPDSPRGVVIDPWNELEHWRDRGISETEYISKQLSLLRNWARLNHVHVWLVAHPQKLRREDGALPVPRPDMISGSAHFWNKTDCALTVYRDGTDTTEVEIHVQKVRFKHVGRVGMAVLDYNRVNGRYHELEEED